MNIIISNSSGRPIYEQITAQVKNAIITEELTEGEALPSMRLLAKECKISVITTKRAYEDLERDGFIVTMPGKGSFVAKKNLEFIKEEQMKAVEGHLARAVTSAKNGGIELDELKQILTILYEED